MLPDKLFRNKANKKHVAMEYLLQYVNNIEVFLLTTYNTKTKKEVKSILNKEAAQLDAKLEKLNSTI